MLVWVSSKNRQRSSSSKSSKNSSNKSIEKASSEKIMSSTIKQRKNYEQLKNIEDVTKKMNKVKKNSINQINMKPYISQNFPIERLEELHQLFCQYDQDQHGILSLMEFQNMLRQGGYSLNLGTVKDIFKQIKQKRRNGIRFEDLVDILNVEDCALDSKKQIQKIFKSYDKKNRGDGFDFEDYFIVSKTLNQQFGLQELREAFDQMDENTDGLVSLEEFKKAMSTAYRQNK